VQAHSIIALAEQLLNLGFEFQNPLNKYCCSLHWNALPEHGPISLNQRPKHLDFAFPHVGGVALAARIQ
jgi:hypothetical protein